MNRWTGVLITILLSTLVALGCSSGSGNPVTPAQSSDLTAAANYSNHVQTHLWGYYDVYIDIETQTATAICNRTIEFAANVVQFVNKPATNLGFKINETPVGTGYIDVDIDVSIKHPFTGLTQYNGYDVRGIFMGDGSASLDYNGDLDYPVLGTDQFMLPDPDDGMGGPDGYTRWFNMSEFTTAGLFGYKPGVFASKGFSGNATLCPYKYFADDLGANDSLWDFLTTTVDNGVFSAGTTNTRHYYLRFPDAKGIKYGYAIVANWEGEGPEFHPSNAPESVGASVAVTDNIYYASETEKGGDLILDLGLFGWGTQPSTIFVESSVLSAVHEFDSTEMTPIGGGDNYSTYHVDIPADNITGTDGNEYWVIAEYDNFDYTNEFGVTNLAGDDPLAAFFRYDLSVASSSFNADPVCDVVVVTTMPYNGFPDYIEFDASGSYDPDGDPFTYEWDFDGDGTFGDSYDAGTDENPQKLFTSNYVGNVCVRLSDGVGGESECCVAVNITIHPAKNISLRTGVEAMDIAIDHGDGDLFIVYNDYTVWRYTASSCYSSGTQLIADIRYPSAYTQISRYYIDAAPNGYLNTVCHSNEYSATYNSTGWNLTRVWDTGGTYISGIDLYPGANGTMLPSQVNEAQAWPTGSSFSNDMGCVYGLTVTPQEAITMVRLMDEGAYAFTVNVNAHRHRYLMTPPPLTGNDRAYWGYIMGTETMPDDKVWLLEGAPDLYASRLTPSGTGWAPPTNAPLAYDGVYFGTGSQTDGDTGFYDPKDITRDTNDRIFVLDLLSTGAPIVKIWNVSGSPSSVGHFGDSTTISAAPRRIEGSDFNGNIFVLHGNVGSTSMVSIFTPSEMP